MENIFRLLLVPAAIVALSACAESSFYYNDPARRPIENSIEIPKNFDGVWDQLVKNLSAGFFVINNIHKVSRIINVSFSSSDPSIFVDCGVAHRTFTTGPNYHARRYDYLLADSSTYYFVDYNGIVFRVVRTTHLEGISIIYVAPTSNGTDVNVNIKYVLNVDFKYYKAGGGFRRDDYTWRFTTKEPLKRAGGGRPECRSNGTLERRILDYAR